MEKDESLFCSVKVNLQCGIFDKDFSDTLNYYILPLSHPLKTSVKICLRAITIYITIKTLQYNLV